MALENMINLRTPDDKSWGKLTRVFGPGELKTPLIYVDGWFTHEGHPQKRFTYK